MKKKPTAEEKIRQWLETEPRKEMDVYELMKDMGSLYGMTTDEVEDAIISLEDKGAVYGTAYGGKIIIGVCHR